MEQNMRKKERRSVDSGTQAGIHVPVGDLVSILASPLNLNLNCVVYPRKYGNFQVQQPKLGANISKNGTKQPKAFIQSNCTQRIASPMQRHTAYLFIFHSKDRRAAGELEAYLCMAALALQIPA